MDWLVGSSQHVACLAANRKLKDVSVEDAVSCSVLHSGGCLANYYIFQGQAAKETSFTIHCESGSLKADLGTSRVGEYLPGAEGWVWTQLGPFERDEFYIRQAKAFLNDSQEGTSSTLEDASHSVKVILAAMESIKTGRIVEVDQ